MSKIRENIAEYINFLKFIFTSSDNVEPKRTTDSQIEQLKAFPQLSEGDKKILEASLREQDNWAEKYLIDYSKMKVEKVEVDEKNAIKKVTKNKSTKGKEEKEI